MWDYLFFGCGRHKPEKHAAFASPHKRIITHNLLHVYVLVDTKKYRQLEKKETHFFLPNIKKMKKKKSRNKENWNNKIVYFTQRREKRQERVAKNGPKFFFLLSAIMRNNSIGKHFIFNETCQALFILLLLLSRFYHTHTHTLDANKKIIFSFWVRNMDRRKYPEEEKKKKYDKTKKKNIFQHNRSLKKYKIK